MVKIGVLLPKLSKK